MLIISGVKLLNELNIEKFKIDLILLLMTFTLMHRYSFLHGFRNKLLAYWLIASKPMRALYAENWSNFITDCLNTWAVSVRKNFRSCCTRLRNSFNSSGEMRIGLNHHNNITKLVHYLPVFVSFLVCPCFPLCQGNPNAIATDHPKFPPWFWNRSILCSRPFSIISNLFLFRI